MKRFLANGLLVVASTVITLVAGEVVLSMLDKPPMFRKYTRALEEVQAQKWADWWVFDPRRGVHFNPVALTDERRPRLRALSRNWARLDTVNAAGFHDADEFAVDVDKWKYRLLFVGDSFTWGASADVGNSFVEVVESQLKNRTPGSLVWNAAIPATGTVQALVSVRKLLPVMKPHVVILGLFENDLTDNLFPLDRFLRTASGVAIAQYRWDKALESPVKVGIEEIERSLRLKIQRQEGGIYGASRIASLLGAVRRETPTRKLGVLNEHKLTRTQFYINELRRECLQWQAELLVLVIPSRHTAALGPTAEYVGLDSILRSENIRSVSVRERLGEDHYASLPDNHWNNQGHLVAANALLEVLDEG